MPEGWEWDETLFKGSAAYYARGRLPYPEGLHDTFAGALELSGSPRLVDVGCGPGVVALTVADLFDEVIGLEPDGAMLAEAERHTREMGLRNLKWVRRRTEDLPARVVPEKGAMSWNAASTTLSPPSSRPRAVHHTSLRSPARRVRVRPEAAARGGVRRGQVLGMGGRRAA